MTICCLEYSKLIILLIPILISSARWMPIKSQLGKQLRATCCQSWSMLSIHVTLVMMSLLIDPIAQLAVMLIMKRHIAISMNVLVVCELGEFLNPIFSQVCRLQKQAERNTWSEKSYKLSFVCRLLDLCSELTNTIAAMLK